MVTEDYEWLLAYVLVLLAYVLVVTGGRLDYGHRRFEGDNRFAYVLVVAGGLDYTP